MAETEYQVSARKYRPQRFDEVTSQAFVTKTLKNAIKNNKTAHSYLLSGPRGTGKTTIARIFAKAMNCPNQKDGEPCNNCDTCREITASIHPDVFELDAASNRGIDDVRAIQDAARFEPMKGKVKFFIVDEVHMLTTQAFNALLKILEEPPKYLIFVLATTNPEKIPQTILSRCQRFILKRFKSDEIIDKLKEIAKDKSVKIDEESLFLIAKLGDGALRDALGVFDFVVSYFGEKVTYKELKEFLNIPDKEMYFGITDIIKAGDTNKLLQIINEICETGIDLQILFNGMMEHLRDMMVTASTKSSDLINESDVIKKMYLDKINDFTESQILRMFKVMMEAEGRFKFTSGQKIMLESLLVELCRVNTEVVDITSLLAQLDLLKVSSPDKSVVNSRIIEEVKLIKKNGSSDSELVKRIKDMFDAIEYDPNDNL